MLYQSPVTVAWLRRLLGWFERHARRLPWRVRRTPYRIVISEVMLQQTRVETVIPYFCRFVKKFPNFSALAQASADEVLRAWDGLGYYQRAHRLRQLAKVVCEQFGGTLPSSYAELRKLPGLGPYMAAAVASLAFGVPIPAVDGNVRRVVCRLNAKNWSEARCRRWLARWMPAEGPGRFNEALIELGATVCRPLRPACGRCPLRGTCQAYARGDPMAVPRARRRKPKPVVVVGAAVVRDKRGRILVTRRPDHAMLGGLWEFPGGKVEPGESVEECIRRELKEELGLEVGVGREIVVVRHEYSHFRIILHAHECWPKRGQARPIHCTAVQWVSPEAARELVFSRADRRIWDALGPTLRTSKSRGRA